MAQNVADDILINCQKCKQSDLELRRMEARVQGLTQDLREAQDTEKALLDEVSEVYSVCVFFHIFPIFFFIHNLIRKGGNYVRPERLWQRKG